MFIAAVWCLWAAVNKSGIDVENAIALLPFGPRGDSSCAMVPFVATVLWGAAKIADLLADPWGTRVAVAIHVVLAVTFVGGIIHERVRLRRAKRARE